MDEKLEQEETSTVLQVQTFLGDRQGAEAGGAVAAPDPWHCPRPGWTLGLEQPGAVEVSLHGRAAVRGALSSFQPKPSWDFRDLTNAAVRLLKEMAELRWRGSSLSWLCEPLPEVLCSGIRGSLGSVLGVWAAAPLPLKPEQCRSCCRSTAELSWGFGGSLKLGFSSASG